MSNERDEVHRYPSKFGKTRYVTAVQFLAEVMCERRAKSEKKGLPLQFWKTAPWDAYFKQQVFAINRLLKRLDPENTGSGPKALSRFIRSERGKQVYSLASAWVVPLVEQAHKVVLAEEVRPPSTEEPPLPEPVATEPPRPAFITKPSILNKLKDL